MKKLLVAVALAGAAGMALAGNVDVERHALGSGQPEAIGNESAQNWDSNIFHAPQYMPGHPTAATLYPRVVDVPCTKTGNDLKCAGYNWAPKLGRGEYLMFRPVIQVDKKPQVITNTVVREVLVEVPAKKKGE